MVRSHLPLGVSADGASSSAGAWPSPGAGLLSVHPGEMVRTLVNKPPFRGFKACRSGRCRHGSVFERVVPELPVRGIPQPELAYGEGLATECPQGPGQGGWQLRINDEPHATRSTAWSA